VRLLPDHRRHVLAVVLSAALIPGSAALAAASVLPPGDHPTGTNLSATPAGPPVVNAVPSVATPQVDNGAVATIATVGPLVFLGGSFSQIEEPAGGGTITQTGIVAFNASTGAIDTAFAPNLDGAVNKILPGPTSDTVYVGGSFTEVNNITGHVMLLNVADGTIASGWTPSSMNGQVNDLALTHGQLLVGGNFTNVGGVRHNGLVAVSPTTGVATSYATIQLTGHHTASGTGGVGPRAMAVSPDGTKMTIVGNFTSAADPAGVVARDQVVRISLGSTSAAVDRTWSTVGFTSNCTEAAFDTDMTDVAYSPDGTYLAIVARGGPSHTTNSDGSRDLCDAVSRWSATATGVARPTWVDYTGHDSLLSVAVSSSAIYVGGHQRWMNNPDGADNAAEGAVPRPSLAALDPVNGLPLAWNPGHTPRGNGVGALLSTGSGLYVGSDSSYIGDGTYYRPRIAFFPADGGLATASTRLSTFPGDLYAASPTTSVGNRTGKHVSASGAVGSAVAVNSSLAWDQTRGAFVVGGNLFYGKASGGFYRRTVTESALGAETAVDPYNDPAWATVQTGSGGAQTYDGVLSSFYSEIPSLTSAFYSAGRIYYTLSGQKTMFSRAFTPDSGIVGADESVVADGFSWTTLTGAVVVGSTMYYSNSGDKELHAIAWAGKATGSSHVVDASPTWSAKSLFAVPDPVSPLAPIAR
jgi:hypothetical protein